VKDLRMFWRDHDAMGQSVMLFGLLGIYIITCGTSRTIDQPVLGQSRRVSEPRHLLAKPGHGDHAVCVPAIFA